MATTLSISSGTVFKTLSQLAEQPGTYSGKKVNAKEVKAALDSFNWGDGKTTKTEVIAAKVELAALKAAGQLTADGQKAVDDWFNQEGVGAPGGFDYSRSAEVFENLQSFLQWNPDSQKGATLTKAEATSMLTVLGDKPSPARIADVIELHDNLKALNKSHDAQTVLNAWLKQHKIAAPADPLAKELKPLLKGVLWPSESDRPLYAVDLGTAPKAGVNVANAFRKATAEGSTANIEVRSFDDTFNQLTEIDDPSDTGSVARTKQFAAIRTALEGKLTNLQIVRAGKIDIDIYALGKDARGHWVGVMSSVVET